MQPIYNDRASTTLLSSAMLVMAAKASSLQYPTEKSPLLHHEPVKFSFKRKYAKVHKCLSSKAAIVTLIWLFTLKVLLHFIQPQVLKILLNDHHALIYFQVLSNLVLCLSPLAGYLADNVFERYKTIRSILFFFILVFIVFGIVAMVYYLICYEDKTDYLPYPLVLTIAVMVYIVTAVCYVTFYANIIQFGMDQLYESPADHQSLYIYWFVWLESLSEFIASGSLSIWHSVEQISSINSHYKAVMICATCALVLLIIATFVIFVISQCASIVKKDWFLILSANINPYRLVYKVTRFAWQHKVPIRRSAFTYCEDEIPSGLDLGKAKYGGPFSVEQVENVKAFYGILKVLILLGLTFFLKTASRSLLSSYSEYVEWKNRYNKILFGGGVWLELLDTVCIPVYILAVRPFIPIGSFGLFRRISVGIIVQLLSLICMIVMVVLAHAHQTESVCILSDSARLNMFNSTIPFPQSVAWFGIQRSLSSLYDMLMSIAIYEFICSQSPQSMKGLLIGLFFAIEGVFSILGTLWSIPFSYISPACDVIFSGANVGLSLFFLLIYVKTVGNYTFRIRDEPDHVHRYVEEYYWKTRPEKYYDY